MIFPVGLALYSRAAPRQVSGVFIGVYYLHLFICNFATGRVAGLIETMSGTAFWTMHAIIIGIGAVVLLVFALLFRKLLAPTSEDKARATPKPSLHKREGELSALVSVAAKA